VEVVERRDGVRGGQGGRELGVGVLYSPGVTEGRNHSEVDACISSHTHQEKYNDIGWHGHCPVPAEKESRPHSPHGLKLRLIELVLRKERER
jgi:hypothetical protein